MSSENAPRFRVVQVRAFVHEIRARMPFRYGNACLTEAPVLTVEATLEDASGARADGLSSDCLPPRWFDKRPEKPYADDVRDQTDAYRVAREAWLEEGSDPATLFELWSRAAPACRSACADRGINDLTASFGISFLERAALDAAARLLDTSFFDLLAKDLTGRRTRHLLPESIAAAVGCRHTVGLADPITTAEIPADERLDDGLPQSLEECVDAYGLRWFKVKVRGDDAADGERLRAIAGALERTRSDVPYAVSLDGNEQYTDVAALRDLLESLDDSPAARRFRDAVEYIEQPLSRDVALDADAAAGIARLSEYRPVIIDESDARLESFERALALGYRGVSHKNCKGIFKSLHNREIVLAGGPEGSAGRHAGAPLFQTAEDLANTPVVPLQQDLATVLALGIPHAERNGHHYFHGLGHLPPEEALAALREHPDLYEERGDGIFLRVRDGVIDCGSLTRGPGYGRLSEVDLDARTPLEDWTPPADD